ncbi:MAG: response regulator [Aestuariivita sp.]|nr:response regulator [Aestuariivita sp.]
MNIIDVHILIVDDDERIRDLLKKYLIQKRFLVTAAKDAKHARRILSGIEFDVIILDVMMPGEDGVSLTQSLRAEIDTPILLLTAKAETEHRISGLEAGADDYLAKPFEPKELLLRINAILRRMPELPAEEKVPKILKLGSVRYDVKQGELWRGNELVHLTVTESQLMKIFSTHLGETVSRSQLVENLGRDRSYAQERAMDVQITRLRRKLEENQKQPRYLQTVRGAGYLLTPE